MTKCWQVTLPVTWLCVTKCDQIVTKSTKSTKVTKVTKSTKSTKSTKEYNRVFWQFLMPICKIYRSLLTGLFIWRKSQPVFIIINPQFDFMTRKETCQKRPTKSCGFGQYTSLPPIACPILFLKTLLCICILRYIYFYKNFFICLVKI